MKGMEVFMIRKTIQIIAIILMALLVFGIIGFLGKKIIDNKKAAKIPVLLYHDVVNILPQADPYNYEYITTTDSLEENIQTLLSNGYSIITIEDLYEIDKDSKELPAKPIIINFDDGLISNYNLVFPILKKYNIKVGMSITTDLVGTNDAVEGRQYFSWNQAKEMYDSGLVEFYSHGKRHIFYTDVPVTDFKSEVVESINTIDLKLNTKCDVFVYPYGSYNSYMVNALKSTDVKIQMYDSGINMSNNIDYSFIKRINIPYGMTGNDIISYIESLQIE